MPIRPSSTTGLADQCGCRCSPDRKDGPNLAEVDIAAYPWSSIAKLNNSVGGSCTAVAIEQNAVLTAAHCIFNRRTNRFLIPGSLHVLLGYEQGKYAVHALVASYTIGPGYDPSRELATASSDWVILKIGRTTSGRNQATEICRPHSRARLSSSCRGLCPATVTYHDR